MRRNDLNTEELRFERLLRTLDRGPAAPDPEFLRQLKDASTAAFVASRPAQPRATRSPTEPPLHPAVGRRRLQAMRVAMMAQDGFARAIRPVHTPFDGDTVFALSTGKRPLDGAMELMRIGSIAADCVARAIARGVFAAETLGAMLSYNEMRAAALK